MDLSLRYFKEDNETSQEYIKKSTKKKSDI